MGGDQTRIARLLKLPPHFPLQPMLDLWDEAARFRRDVGLIGRTHGLLWFGPEGSDGDPLAIARLLALPTASSADGDWWS
jgi:hypothetical protein